MSGHTNRNRRNNGNSKSRHGPQRQRGPDGRGSQNQSANQSANQSVSQPKNAASGGERDAQSDEKKAQKSDNQPPRGPRPVDRPDVPANAPVSESARGVGNSESTSDVEPTPNQSQEAGTPRGRAPFVATSRGSRAYIPASGPRLVSGQNGHNGANGTNGTNGTHGTNGYMPPERQAEPPTVTSEYDDGEGDGTAPTPTTWRVERLNGGTDTTPREPFRPESRGEVGPLIDSLHEIFAQDRTMASRGDSTRCGICYLHFPLSDLEYREPEGFYVCAGCKRSLGHQQVMMIRRQQA